MMRRPHPFKAVKQAFLDLRIQRKLLLSFALLATLPVVLTTVFYVINSRDVLENKSSQYTADILTELQKNIENTAFELNTIFTQIHNSAETQELLTDFPTDSEYFEKARQTGLTEVVKDVFYSHPIVESIYLLPYENRSRFSAVPQVTAGVTESDLERIEKGKGETVWLRCGERSITYGRMIFSLNDGTPLGYLIINLPEDALFRIYSDISIYENESIFITDQIGTILSHENKELLGQRAGTAYLNLLGTSNDFLFSPANIADDQYYISCRAINNQEWYLFYQIRSSDFEGDFLTLFQILMVMTVFILLLSITVSAILARSISNPIKRLSETMQLVQQGDFSIRSNYHAKDEVGILSDNFNAMIENTNTLIQTIYQKELLKQQAELRFLKFQINPHFLYNTLETINWISRIKGVPEAGEIAKALGDLMREGLRDDDFVPIKDEIKNVENYLLIQQYRYGEKININLNFDPAIEMVKTPKFILQPLIENALVHGLDSKISGGTINVFGGFDGDDVLITVEDNGVGIPEDILRNLLNENLRKSEDSKHPHIGVLNVHKRLQLYFGASYGLSINSEVGTGTVVTIRIPGDKN